MTTLRAVVPCQRPHRPVRRLRPHGRLRSPARVRTEEALPPVPRPAALVMEALPLTKLRRVALVMVALPLTKPQRLGVLPAWWPLPPLWKPPTVVALKMLCSLLSRRNNRLMSLVDVLAFDLFLRKPVPLVLDNKQHHALQAEYRWRVTSSTTGRLTRRATLAALLSRLFTPSLVVAESRMINMLVIRRRQLLKVIPKCDFPAEIR